jgi:hypothetical protein
MVAACSLALASAGGTMVARASCDAAVSYAPSSYMPCRGAGWGAYLVVR